MHGLSADQWRQLKAIYETFADVQPGTFEETVTDFKKDLHPDKEIAIWQQMAEAYKKFIGRRPAIDPDTKKEAYQVIVLRSMMPAEEVLEQVQLTRLQDAEVKELFSYYKPTPVPVTVETR